MKVQKNNFSAKCIPKITIGEFYKQHGELLHLSLVAGKKGFNRLIREGSINRPGLQLSGYLRYFPKQRVQIIGWGEMSYLKSLPSAESEERIRQLFLKKIPCL